MDKHLHIVTHDVPWPADYGGVVDLFYKIKTLHQLGIRIHLHCFTDGRAEQNTLNHFCESVHYYPRNKKRSSLSLRLPYIVSSRNHPDLLKNLQQDDYPVLLEGIHCSYLLSNHSLANRKVFLRLHNVECRYYERLATHERNFFKRLYYTTESRILKRYERKIAGMATGWGVSEADVDYYKKEFGAKGIEFLPVFLPGDQVKSLAGQGSFCLYHGNLSVNENERAAEWLLKEVFSKTSIPFVMAGKNPSTYLQHLAHVHPHTCIVANPSEHEMQDLIKKAHINILPSFNQTGVKLKLLNALFNGRHCIVNTATVEGSGLEGQCHIATDAHAFISNIEELFQVPFTNEDINQRAQHLQSVYNNEQNGRKLISWIY